MYTYVHTCAYYVWSQKNFAGSWLKTVPAFLLTGVVGGVPCPPVPGAGAASQLAIRISCWWRTSSNLSHHVGFDLFGGVSGPAQRTSKILKYDETH